MTNLTKLNPLPDMTLAEVREYFRKEAEQFKSEGLNITGPCAERPILKEALAVWRVNSFLRLAPIHYRAVIRQYEKLKAEHFPFLVSK